jgi:hypothetical protein
MAKEDTVVLYDLGVAPVSDVPYPCFLSTEDESFLLFTATAGIAVVRIERCLLSKFGYPNDEALGGHPLYDRGLDFYNVFEVINSSWVRQVNEQNTVCFPNSSDWQLHHWIFTFHDSTFECMAEALHVEVVTKPFREVFVDVSARIAPKGD